MPAQPCEDVQAASTSLLPSPVHSPPFPSPKIKKLSRPTCPRQSRSAAGAGAVVKPPLPPPLPPPLLLLPRMPRLVVGVEGRRSRRSPRRRGAGTQRKLIESCVFVWLWPGNAVLLWDVSWSSPQPQTPPLMGTCTYDTHPTYDTYTHSCEIALEQCQGQLSQIAKHLTMNLPRPSPTTQQQQQPE